MNEIPERRTYQAGEAGPATEHPALLAMRPRWVLPLLLLGGTEAMRLAGEAYLPRGEEEDKKQWQKRLNGTVLYNYYARAVSNLSSLPTGEPSTIREPTPLQEDMIEDIDRRGQTLTQYVRDCLADLSVFGMAITLTSYPRKPTDDDDRPMTVAEKKDLGMRPYFIRVPPADLVSWDHDDRGRLIHFVYRETTRRKRSAYQLAEVHAVIEWTPSECFRWELQGTNHQDDPGGVWAMVDQVPNELGYIPVRVAYAGQAIAPFTVDPPLEELAELNGQHWRDRSAQNGVERVTRNPLLVINDVQASDTQKFSVGPYTALAINKPAPAQRSDALTFIESDGKAAQIGRELLKTLEDRMESLSVEPLTLRHSAPTATQIMVDDSRSVSDLQSWVKSLESSLGLAFEDAANWEGEPPAEDRPAVSISKDFATLPNTGMLEAVERDYELGTITLETYLYERARYGVYSDEFSPEEEARKVQAADNNDNDADEEIED